MGSDPSRLSNRADLPSRRDGETGDTRGRPASLAVRWRPSRGRFAGSGIVLTIAILILALGGSAVFAQAIRSQTGRVVGAIQNQIRQAVRPKLQIHNPAGPVSQLALGSNGKILAIGYEKSVRIWDLEAGVEQTRFAIDDPPRVLAVSGDGKRVAIGTGRGEVIVLDAATGAAMATYRVHSGEIKAIGISPDHTAVVSAGVDGTVRLWDGYVGLQHAALTGQDGVTAVAVGKDDRTVVAGGPGGRIILWNAAANGAPTSFSVASPGIASVGFNTEGQVVAVGSDGAAYAWNPQAPTAPARTVRAAQGQVRSVRLSADGSTAAVAKTETTTEVVNMRDGSVERQITTTPGSARFVLVDVAKKRLVIGGEDGIVRILNVDSGTPLAQIISTLNGWAALDEQGRFDGDPGGMKDVEWLAAQLNLPIDNFSSNYFEPGLIGKYMRDRPDLAAPAPQQVQAGVYLPPRVTVTAQAGPYNGGSEILVTAVAQDQGGGIGELRLYQNGKLVPAERRTGEQRTQNSLTQTYRVALVAGPNRFEGIGTNPEKIDGEPGRLDLAAAGQVALPNLDIVTIGINKYRDPRFTLDYSVPDALSILQNLSKTSVGVFNRVVAYQLTDDAATRDGIIRTLNSLQQLPAEDVLIVYLAGHGVIVDKEWYLLPQDAAFTEEGIKRTGISAAQLQQFLSRARPQRMLLLIDSCHSGATVDALTTSLDRRVLRQVGRETGVALLAGARRDQSAAELPKLGHGAFTYILLEGLGGKADVNKKGQVTAGELLSYSTAALPSLTKSLANFMQVPVAYARGDDFEIAR
jgi:WD40 repeat protein